MNFPNIDVHGIKTAFNKVKAAVLNISELEQKVKEATNSDPWGANSTLMQQIADATFTSEGFNEAMPCIYKRFSQEGRTWRNVYKTLVLIEFMVKNGSERAVEYCKSHIYDVKACLNFQFIDEKGKDQGINIRHRSKLILDLLQDDRMIQDARLKAKEYREKMRSQASSIESNSVSGYGSMSSRDYESYGNEDTRYGGSSYNSSSYKSSNNKYPSSYNNSSSETRIASKSHGADSDTEFSAFQSAPVVQNPPAPIKIVNLLDFDDPVIPAPSVKGKASEEDEWAEFTAAPTTTSSQPVIPGNQSMACQQTFLKPVSLLPMKNGSTTDGSSGLIPNQFTNQFYNSNSVQTSLTQVNPSNLLEKPQNTSQNETSSHNVWNKELVDLDSLSQFAQSKPNKPIGPSMNAMIIQSGGTLEPSSASSSSEFSGFTSAMLPNQGQQHQFQWRP